MRTRKVEFEVPVAKLPEFFTEVVRLGLTNEVTNCDNEEVTVEIVYTAEEADEVDELEDFFDDLLGDQDEE